MHAFDVNCSFGKRTNVCTDGFPIRFRELEVPVEPSLSGGVPVQLRRTDNNRAFMLKSSTIQLVNNDQKTFVRVPKKMNEVMAVGHHQDCSVSTRENRAKPGEIHHDIVNFGL